VSEVVHIGCVTRLDLQPDQILESAVGKVSDVVVIGFDNDGDLYFASSKADGGDALWLLELAKRKLFEAAEEYEG
jgi:hypothetical protein